jgi:hypothetical protein
MIDDAKTSHGADIDPSTPTVGIQSSAKLHNAVPLRRAMPSRK